MAMKSTPLCRLLTKTLNQQINSGATSIDILNSTASNNTGIKNNKIGKLDGKFICDSSLTDGEMIVL